MAPPSVSFSHSKGNCMRYVLPSILVLSVSLLVTAAYAAQARKSAQAPAAQRDCRPINGRFGYYGNPWCDTGSYRLEDLEYRQRQARLRKLKGHREE
jgi:hypothetical protein